MAGTWEDVLYQSRSFRAFGNDYIFYYGLHEESEKKQKLSFSITNGPGTSTLGQEFNVYVTVYDKNLKNGQIVVTRTNFIASPYGYVENNNPNLNVEVSEIYPLDDIMYYSTSAMVKYVIRVNNVANTLNFYEEQIYSIDLTNYLKPDLTVNNPVINNSNTHYQTPEGWSITQNISLVNFEYSYELKKGSNFKSIVCKEGNSTIQTTVDSSFLLIKTNSPINKSGSVTYSITLTDSRDISTTVNKTFTVNPYINPEVKSITVNRCLADGTIDEYGTYILLKATYTADNRQANQITSILGAITDTATGTVLDVNHPLTLTVNSTTSSLIQAESTDILGEGEIDTTKEYTVSASIFDKPGSLNHKWTRKTANVYLSYCTMDFLAGGKGIAFGTTSTKEGFECDMNADFDKALNVDGGTSLRGTVHAYGDVQIDGVTTVNEYLAVNGGAYVSGNLDANGTLRFSANNQIYQSDGRTYLRLYPAGNTNKTYHIATTGKQTGADLDSHMTLLVSSHHYKTKYRDYTGILNVVFRHYNNAKYASIVWLANDGWPDNSFVLKIGGTNGNMFADLWYTAPDVYSGLHVTVLDGGSRATRQYNLLQLRFDNLSGGSYSSIPASNPQGLGAYTETATIKSGPAGLISEQGFWGLTIPDRTNGGFIRTPLNGIIPYAPSNDNCWIGTGDWPFHGVCSHHLYLGAQNATEQVKDVVVATGNDEPWKWRKYASGYAECEAWFNRAVSGMTTDNWHWITTSNRITFANYPSNMFSSKPIVTITAIANNNLWCINADGGTQTTPPGAFAISAQAYTGNCQFNVRARGYWRGENFNRI